MKQAILNDTFFEYSPVGLDGEAARLIMNKLNDPVCARFLGNPSIGYEFTETTAAHVERTYQTLEQRLSAVLPDNAQTKATLERHKAMITVHDTSDIIKELIIASTETNPSLQSKCAASVEQFDFIVTPFVYRLALFANAEKNPEIFNDTIDRLRNATMTGEQQKRGLTLDEVIAFSAQTIHLLKGQEKGFAKHANWNDPVINHKVQVMMDYYNEIEQSTSFDGLQSKIHEKCDGTDYASQVSADKRKLRITPNIYHVPTHLLNRINGRFEKNLFRLAHTAGVDESKLLSVAATVNYCYDISSNVYSQSKPYITLEQQLNEPTEHDAPSVHQHFVDSQLAMCYNPEEPPEFIHHLEVLEMYNDAKNDLQHNGVLWLPENGKTMIESKAPVKLTLPENVKNALNARPL